SVRPGSERLLQYGADLGRWGDRSARHPDDACAGARRRRGHKRCGYRLWSIPYVAVAPRNFFATLKPAKSTQSEKSAPSSELPRWIANHSPGTKTERTIGQWLYKVDLS